MKKKSVAKFLSKMFEGWTPIARPGISLAEAWRARIREEQRDRVVDESHRVKNPSMQISDPQFKTFKDYCDADFCDADRVAENLIDTNLAEKDLAIAAGIIESARTGGAGTVVQIPVDDAERTLMLRRAIRTKRYAQAWLAGGYGSERYNSREYNEKLEAEDAAVRGGPAVLTKGEHVLPNRPGSHLTFEHFDDSGKKIGDANIKIDVEPPIVRRYFRIIFEESLTAVSLGEISRMPITMAQRMLKIRPQFVAYAMAMPVGAKAAVFCSEVKIVFERIE
jgi:hypothetical protein